MKYPKLNLYQMIVFFYVANEKSITAAADKLCLTQPTVTSHIKSLEASIRLKLIEVNKKRVILTPHGEGFYHYCKEIYNQAMGAERFVDLQTKTSLNISVSPIFISTIARAITIMSNITDSSLKLNIKCGGSPFDLIRQVLDSNVDIAVIPAFDYKNERLIRVRISDSERLAFYASCHHPIFESDRVDWQDLTNFPLIVSKDAYLLQKLGDKLASEKVTLPLKMNLTTDNIESCKIIVQDGKSISVSLFRDLEREIEYGKLKILPLPTDLWLEVDAVVDRGIFSSTIIQNFISSLKSTFLTQNQPEPRN